MTARAILLVGILSILLAPSLFRAQTAADVDFDDSGEVDFADFVLFAQAFGSTRAEYDLNGDGRVNFADFVAFAQLFGQEIEQEENEGNGKGITVELPDGMKMAFIWIEPGTVRMGSGASEGGFDDEKPQHGVSIGEGFYLGKYEVTQEQWKAVMGTAPWSGKEGVVADPDHPAVYVSWEDAQAFIQKLNDAAGSDLYRLPTAAEWEYACRAKTTSPWSFGENSALLGKYAWNQKNTYGVGERYAHQVGTKLPNPWGLYDMHGNVSEWCQDWYSESYYRITSRVDPQGPEEGTYRVARGGDFSRSASLMRSAYRGFMGSGDREPSGSHTTGFRLVKLPDESDTASDREITVTTAAGTTHKMMLVPAGSFTMGWVGRVFPEGSSIGESTTAHFVDVERYYIDIYEVTNLKYVAFLNALGKNSNAAGRKLLELSEDSVQIRESAGKFELKSSDYGNHPVVSVTWYGGQAYCEWIGGQLPSGAQWEKAARGTEGRTYPWGNEWDNRRANIFNSGDPFDNGTTPVGYYDGGSNRDGYQTMDGRSPYGIHDMSGNVEEWVLSKNFNYPYIATDGRELVDNSEDRRIIRGTRWLNSPGDIFLLPSWDRGRQVPTQVTESRGFRCAR